MIGLWRVYRYEFRRQGRRISYLFMSIGLPLIGIALFFILQLVGRAQAANPAPLVSTPAPASISKSDNNPFSIDTQPTGLVDQSGLIAGTRVSTGVLKPYPTVDDANAALTAGRISGYYLIPADYLTSGTASLTRLNFTNMLGGVSESALQHVLQKALAARTGITDPSVVARLTERSPDISNHRLNVNNQQVQSSAGFGLSFLLVYVFALALVIGTFATSGYLMQTVMEERQSRVVELMLSSLRARDLLIGKVLALGTLGLLQVSLWAAAALFVVKQIAGTSTIPGGIGLDITIGQLAVLIAFFLVGYLMFGGIYAIVGVLSNSLREGPQMATFITLPAMLPLYLTSMFASTPDGSLATALSLFPLTAPLGMVMRVAISPVPVWQIAISLILVLITGIGCLWAASKLFRIVTLLSGQTPTFRDIPKLLRQSST